MAQDGVASKKARMGGGPSTATETKGEIAMREDSNVNVTLRIDPEFSALIPPLTEEEYAGLERSILEEGVREPIVTWRGVIVDGHNRYEIATAHGLDFDTVEYGFDSRDDAKLWMIENQLSRRNLETIDKGILAQAYVAIEKERANNRKTAGINLPDYSQEGESYDFAGARFGVSGKTVRRVERIMEQPNSEEIIADIRAGNSSISSAEKQIREAEKKAERQAAIEEAKAQPRSASYVDIFATDNKYRVVYADPPWSYNDKQNTTRLGGAEKHYGTMPLEDICAIKPPTEKDAVLFLWATSPLLREAFDVIDAWGFEYKTSFVWDKVAPGLGHYNSVRHELLMVCTKGSCTPDVGTRPDSVVSIERTEHSAKPAYFRDLIDELYPIGRRVELFAREAHDGWDVWGDMS